MDRATSELAHGRRRLALHRAALHAVESLESRTMLASVVVDTDTTFQTIRGIGGNYAQGRHIGSPFVNDLVGQFTLDTLSVAHSRVGIPLRAWEPVNDNNDPGTANYGGGGFVNSGDVRNVFLLMRDLSDRGIPITVSVWNAPDWMVSNPSNSQQRIVPQQNFDELVESITTFITTAKQQYGVQTIDAVSFNEADGGYNLLQTAAEQASIIKKAGPRFDVAGIGEVKWLVGDTATPNGLYNYAKAILDDPATHPYLGAISYHSWNALSTTDSTFTKIYSLAQQYGKEVWCEEVGYNSQLYRYPDTFKTWSYASQVAQTYYKILKLSNATVADYWEYQDDYTLADDKTLKPNPAYYIVKELAEGLRPGTEMIAAVSDTSSVLALGGKHVADDAFMLQLINTSTSAEEVTINGLPSSALQLVRSSAAANHVQIGAYNPINGQLTLTLPGDSVSTLKGELSVPSPWAHVRIGWTGATGTAVYSSNRFRMSAAGMGWPDRSMDDALEFVSQPVGDASSIQARTLVMTDGEAGIMFRSGTDIDSRYVTLSVDASGTVALRVRDEDGAESQTIASMTDVPGGALLRLSRNGSTFVAASSEDGSNWTTIGVTNVSMPDNVFAGLVAASGDEGVLAQFEFSDVQVAGLAPTTPPARLSATAGTGPTSQVTLNWTDTTGNETGFEVQRSNNGVDFQGIATLASNVSTFTDSSVAGGNRYHYRVRALNAAGNSSFSSIANVLVPRIYEAENAAWSGVSIDTNNPGYLGSGFANFKNLSGSWLEWTIDLPDSGTYSLDWRYAQTTTRAVELKIDGAVVNPAYSFTKTSTLSSWTYASHVATLSAGTHKVRLTTTGQDGPNVDSLRVRSLPATAPTNLAATANGASIDLSWNVGGASDAVYRIERSIDGSNFVEIGITAPGQSSFADTSAASEVTYYYLVRAENTAGTSKYSNQASATRVAGPSAPATPTDMTVTADSTTEVSLTWRDNADDESAYRIDYSSDGLNFSTIASLSANATSFNRGGLMPGAAHHFRVYAERDGLLSGPASGSATTPLAVPSLSVDLSGSSPSLAWAKVTNATSYLIDRSSGGAWQQIKDAGDVSSYVDSTVSKGVTYLYRIRAINSVTASGYSNTASITTPAAVAPVVNAGADKSALEGALVTFNGSFTDSDGPGGSHTYAWNFGDGTATVSNTLTPSHVFADNGTYTVTLTVTDGDNAVGTDTLDVTVSNASPVVNAGQDIQATGSSVTFSGQFTDAGPADTHQIAWDFGDGTSAAGALTPTHVYASSGTYVVKLTVTDDDGGVGSDTLLVTVPAAPTSVTLTSSTTSFVRDGKNASKNYGSSTGLEVQFTSKSGDTRESYIRFDLAGLSGPVKSARLRIYGALNRSTTTGVTIGAYGAANAGWSETGITWNNRPSATTGMLSSVRITSSGNGWYELDATAFVNAELAAGRTSATIILRSTTSSSLLAKFNSDDASSNRPQLVVSK